jgi:hypothetical protein
VENGRPSLYLVEAVFSLGWVGGERFGACGANPFASRFNADATLAFRANPGEVAEKGEEIGLKETDAPGPREFAVAAFCALHRLPPLLLDVHSQQAD